MNGSCSCKFCRQRVEIGLAAKEVDENSRRERDSLSMERKFLNGAKRKLRKKMTIADAAAQVNAYHQALSVLGRVFVT